MNYLLQTSFTSPSFDLVKYDDGGVSLLNLVPTPCEIEKLIKGGER